MNSIRGRETGVRAGAEFAVYGLPLSGPHLSGVASDMDDLAVRVACSSWRRLWPIYRFSIGCGVP